MEDIWEVLYALIAVFAAFVSVYGLLKKMNEWIYEKELGEKKGLLPPGDLGWPIIGNMFSFLRAFKSRDPDSFIKSYTKRYGRIGIYKSFMFGSPTILVTTPETCKKVLMDDEHFKPGWPRSTVELMGRKSFISIPYEHHKWLRRLTSAPVNGPEALSVYITYIEQCVLEALERWSTMGEIEFLTELRKLTFKIIVYIFLSSEGESVMEGLEREYTALNLGVRAMAINLPGFAYHKALKARKKLVKILQLIVNQRREKRAENPSLPKKDMMDALIDVTDDSGRKLDDEEVIDILVMYLNAGHESSGHITLWATILLQEHPEFLQKAKVEQEEIKKSKEGLQKGLTLKETRKMEYLSLVIDETLRLVNISSVVFRQAIKDVNVNGYLIPKGWKVQLWFRNVHMDNEVYTDAKQFNPNRWENFTPKAGVFIPFGGGSRLCPGKDLAKLEISIFLHYFLLGYELKRSNPNCPLRYLPHPRPKDNCLGKIIKLPVKST